MSRRAIAAAQGKLRQHTHVAARAGGSIPGGLKWWELHLLREMLPAETLRWLTRLCEPIREALVSGESDQRAGVSGTGCAGEGATQQRPTTASSTAPPAPPWPPTPAMPLSAARTPDRKTDSVCRYWLNCQRHAQRSGERCGDHQPHAAIITSRYSRISSFIIMFS